jgi:hypothetical protein
VVDSYCLGTPVSKLEGRMSLHSSVGSYLLGVLIEFAMDDAAVKAQNATVSSQRELLFSCLCFKVGDHENEAG